MTEHSLKRGAKISSPKALAAATHYRPKIRAPENFITVPQQISMWGNSTYGDCVTAEEAFAKACHNSEIFISDDEVIAWATQHHVLEGADPVTVMTAMQTDGFPYGSYTEDDGPFSMVNYRNSVDLQSAISEGPVKMIVAADQLEAVCTPGETWFGVDFNSDTNYDHCVSLCGYGTIAWLAQQLGAQVPAGIDGTKPGYAMFTWDSIGIIDTPSMIAVTSEAWLRSPTTLER
jgi:hypothetical protein